MSNDTISISIIKPTKAPEPNNGDIISGNEYLWELLDKKTIKNIRAYPLSYESLNHWKALERFGLDTTDIQDEARYECPFRSGNHFFRIYPIAISEVHSHEVNESSKFLMEYIMKRKESLNDHIYMELSLSEVEKSFMGHGYSQYILPHDGFGSWEWAKIKLSDGRFLFAIYWEWYNK